MNMRAEKGLVAYVTGNGAAKFLSGVPPTNFYKEQFCRYALLYRPSVHNNKETIPCSTKHRRPIVECCIQLYYNYTYNELDIVTNCVTLTLKY